jgi:hypothetical protein
MGNKKITYEEITGYIRNISPVLDNPEELTQNIMTQIECLAKNRKKHTVIRITGWLSGAAACLLLCLLVYETVQLSAYSCIPDVKRIRTASEVPALSKPEIAEMVREKVKLRNRKERIYTLYSSYIQGNNNSK